VRALAQDQKPSFASDAEGKRRHVLTDRAQKISFGEMRANGVCDVLI
jgi:hypothetical protein